MTDAPAAPGPGPLAQARCLIVDRNRRTAKQLGAALTGVAGEVEAQAELTALPDDGQYDLLCASLDSIPAEMHTAFLERFAGLDKRTKLLLFSGRDDREHLVRLFDRYALTNLMAKNGEDFHTADVIVTARKVLTADVFGVEKYFSWGLTPRTLDITRSAQKHDVVEAVDAYGQELGIGGRFRQLLQTVADEFVTNALYNAPVDQDGAARYSHVDRKVAVALDRDEHVRVQYMSDGERMGIAVRDPFGSIEPQRILHYLAKCLRGGKDQVDQKRGGAGLGLYYVFDAVSHFVINIRPGLCTEMIGLTDMRGGYRKFAGRAKSFNLFVVE